MARIGPVTLDGYTVSPDDVYLIGNTPELPVLLSNEASLRISRAEEVVSTIVQSDETVYGINTGFGNFANVVISKHQIETLQYNLIRSHAVGMGDPLTIQQSRMLLALRINVLAKGHSGIRLSTVKQLLAALNANCIPVIPCQGTVGASGDLAPLAHLALGLLGEGLMWDPTSKAQIPALEVLKANGLVPLQLGPKEGLALINGTQMITALGCEAVVRCRQAACQADIIAALTIEALRGTVTAFHPQIHAARPHKGQIEVARRIRTLLQAKSEISNSHLNCGTVQDPYTLRCIPQVHGIVNDTIEFVYNILFTECNSATDNPMVFPEFEDMDSSKDRPFAIISGGNFHGEYPAKALDYLAIAVHELAQISERRIERLVNSDLSGLPAFLVQNGGLNSGFMMMHVTAASLVSENKVLCHPSSVDSLPTSASKEDHVSMGGFAARKAVQVVDNVEKVLAIELLAACQGIHFLRPLRTTDALERVIEVVRREVDPLIEDRYMAPDMIACHNILRNNRVEKAVEDLLTPAASPERG